MDIYRYVVSFRIPKQNATVSKIIETIKSPKHMTERDVLTSISELLHGEITVTEIQFNQVK